MSDSSNKAKSIFLAALEGHAPEQWPAFLNEACGDDAALRGRVEQLLRARSTLGSFHEAMEATIDQPMREGPGTIIGRYKLLQQIGEGGMGTVYMAEQTEPVQRKVALKIIKPGMDSAQVIARFEAERQALAMMDHVNIARVLDVGTTEAGRPYFVMELVHGVSITKYCDDNRLTPRQQLELFVPVCQAIHHAHQKGIIHRDIKPSNVMITLCDGKPVPKVIDFGVAKATEQRLTERTLFTQYGAMVGTPEYMSPEQAEMSALGVDTRSDIYSLGVLLYELLTGSTPLINKRVREAGFIEILRMIKEDDPPRPSNRLSDSGDELTSISARRQTEPAKLAILLRGEVDCIVMKCLEKDRTRRYESAAALARDVQNHLDDKIVEARPPSITYRVGKFARKHKAALVVGSAFVLLLVVGMVVSFWQAVRAQTERDLARMAMTRHVAERLNGKVRELAMVGHSAEAALAALTSGEWEEADLKNYLTLLMKDDRIHGLTLAYEANEGPKDKKQAEYGLYVYRNSKKELQIIHLEPGYCKFDWFRKPREGKPHWTGPGFDEDAKTWMVAYSLPMRRHGKEKPVGVLSVDLDLKYFNSLWGWLKELNPGDKSYGFVVNRTGMTAGKGQDTTGVFISHPTSGAGNAKTEPPKIISKLGDGDRAFMNLSLRIVDGETGHGIAWDATTKKRSAFFFTPVGTTGWSFVAVMEK